MNANGQFDFADRNNYLNTTSQGPAFPQVTLPSNGFSTQEMGQYKRNSISSQSRPSPTHLNLQSSNHQFPPSFSNPFPGEGDDAFLLDPSLQSAGQPQNQSINPAELMGSMSPSRDNVDAPPNIMQMDTRPSPHQSPSMQQGRFYSPAHSRQASIDPTATGLSHGQQGGEWSGMLGDFHRHRRAPSEHSDVSSVAPSPYLKQESSFDPLDQNHSPLLNPQQDPNVYQGTLGIERFRISDPQQQPQHPGVSPRHSPYHSPRMSPHQGLGIAPDSQFILPSNDMDNQFTGGPGPQIYTSHEQSSPSMDMGQATQMEAPSINVEFAPQQHMDNSRGENDIDALSPPERGNKILNLARS